MILKSFNNYILCRESIVIPKNKPCIILEGEGSARTTIDHKDHQSINKNATFLSFAPNVIASGITFKVNMIEQPFS